MTGSPPQIHFYLFYSVLNSQEQVLPITYVIIMAFINIVSSLHDETTVFPLSLNPYMTPEGEILLHTCGKHSLQRFRRWLGYTDKIFYLLLPS